MFQAREMRLTLEKNFNLVNFMLLINGFAKLSIDCTSIFLQGGNPSPRHNCSLDLDSQG